MFLGAYCEHDRLFHLLMEQLQAVSRRDGEVQLTSSRVLPKLANTAQKYILNTYISLGVSSASVFACPNWHCEAWGAGIAEIHKNEGPDVSHKFCSF